MKASCAALSAVLLSISTSVFAADYPAPKQGDWVAKDFKFHTGEVMPELKLHYTIVGEPTGHGTTGNTKFYSEQVRQLLQTAPQRTM